MITRWVRYRHQGQEAFGTLDDTDRIHQHRGHMLGANAATGRSVLLEDNLTDLAIMVRPPADLDTLNQPFAPHPYLIVAPPGHPMVERKGIPAAEVMGQPFVVRERGSDTWRSMREAFGGDLSALNVAMEIRSTETIKQAVMAGFGVSFLSAHTVSRELQSGALRVLDVEGFPLLLHWYVVHRRTKRLAPVAQAFRNFLLEEGAELIARAVPWQFDPDVAPAASVIPASVAVAIIPA